MAARSGASFIAWLGAIVVFGAVMAFMATSLELPPSLVGDDDKGSAERTGVQAGGDGRGRGDGRREGERRGEPPLGKRAEETARDAGAAVEGVAVDVWRAIRRPLAGAGALLLLVAAMRGWDRRRRRYTRLWLIPHRADEARPEDVQRLLEAWHQQLIRRWWVRIALGQPGIALEAVLSPDSGGDYAARLSIVCPEDLVSSIEGTLLACYPDSRLVRGRGGLPPVRRVVRLKKRQVFVWALRQPDARHSREGVMDAVLNQMAGLGTTSVVQYTLVPTPAAFDRYSRWRYSSIERASEQQRAVDPSQPGLRSEVLNQELEGGLGLQHRPLFFSEIRVASTGYKAAAAIAGGVRGESAAENRLVERYMRPYGRGALYLRRLRAGVGNPLPGWRRGVLSSTEVAALWQLPSPGLRSVRVARAPIPRMPAPPEVSRRPEHALGRDENGPVGIYPEDKTDGLGLMGGQKTGKTSVLCRTVHADGLDPRCAMVVLMPKPGDAEKALSMVPRGRTVHYLDLERPQFGINPLLAAGDPAMVADKIVDAFRDVNVEGDIRGSSDRFLRQAAQAAIGASRTGVVDGPPTLWHMYRILIPVERAFRERVVEALSLEPRYADTATFFGRELASDLESAPGQTTAKLDAPRNKLLRLMVESLDKVLRHPVQLDLDEVVRNREVLIVDGKMGTFGADNCRVMMQFILNALYGTLQRQQQLPEAERVRVALKVDEAHLVLNESFADALATLRSAGLEVVAAWQYSEQISDPKIRSGLMSLLRQRCMFSMGESDDAREMSQVAMSVYSDLIRDDSDSRARLRLTPDTIINLPNHFAVCSWISKGARVPAFLAKTLPLETVDEVVEHHLAVQRERGCHVPERLPDPLPEVDWKGLRELPTKVVGEDGEGTRAKSSGGRPAATASEESRPAPASEPGANGAGASNGGRGGGARVDRGRPSGNGHGTGTGDEDAAARAAGLVLDFDPGATSVSNPNESSARPAPPLPGTYTELDLDDVRGLIWDKVTPVPADRRHEPSHRELEILGALWSYRFLFASQIWRRWWSGSSQRSCQRGLNRMAKAGWVRRFKLQTGERGTQQRVYCLTRQGFDLGQERIGRRGNYIDPEATWREPVVTDPRRILRSLHVNGWVLAFDSRAGKVLRSWRGPRVSRMDPPKRRVRGQWVEIEPGEVIVGNAHKLRDYDARKFESVSPDATLELSIPTGDSRLRFDLLVEIDRGSSVAASEDRLRRYDGLISGWSGMLDRYQTLGTPPVVVFVCEDEPRATKLLRIADRTMTARLAKPGTEETEWPHPGRRGIFFACERDLHQGSLEALALPELPPDLRERLHGRRARTCQPRRVHLIEPRLIDLA
jgi:hypothetical protein